MEAVGLYLDAGAADIVAELDEGPGRLDGLRHHGGIRVVVALVAADADHCHRAVGEAFPDLFSLRGAERGLHLMRVGGSQLDPQDLARCTIFDEGGEIPVLSPEIGDQAELHGRARRGQGASQQGGGRAQQCSRGQGRGPL